MSADFRISSTITATKTVTTTTTTDIAPSMPYIQGDKCGINTIEVRQETEIPSKTPDYASVCSGTSRYSSACSCIGLTPTTTILRAPKTTTTIMVTETKTVDYRLPTFEAYQWGDSACSEEIGSGFPPNVIFEFGKCVNLPVSASIIFESFSPGSK
jgi:hypothetical protein